MIGDLNVLLDVVDLAQRLGQEIADRVYLEQGEIVDLEKSKAGGKV